MEILKVSTKSNVNSLAGAIVWNLKDNGKVEMQAVGAGAVNQAVKAIAIARGFVASSGIDLICVPAFATVNIENEDRTAMKFIIRGNE